MYYFLGTTYWILHTTYYTLFTTYYILYTIYGIYTFTIHCILCNTLSTILFSIYYIIYYIFSMYHILLMILKGGRSRKNGIPAGPPNGDRSADRRMLSGARFRAAVGGPPGLRPQHGQNPIFTVLRLQPGISRAQQKRFRFFWDADHGGCADQRVQKQGQDKFSGHFASNVHPFYEEYILLWEEEVKCSPLIKKNTLLSEKRSCSRMSLQRQMLTPYMKNTFFFEKRRCSRMSLQRQMFTPFRIHSSLRRGGHMFTPLWRIHSSLRRGGQMFTSFMMNTLFFEKRRSNVHPFYEEYTLLREEEVQPDVSTETNVHPFYEEYTLLWEEEVKCSPLLWRIHY